MTTFLSFFLMLFLFYLLLCVLLYLFQERMIFFPQKLSPDYNFDFSKPHREVNITSGGANIHGLHFQAENNKGVILYFHGNAGSLAGWGFVGEELVELNYDVLMIDYRSYGKSMGKISEKALLQDGIAVYEYLRKSYSKDEIVIFGRSLGSGVATYLASKKPAKLLILESPFYSFTDLARHHYPLFPPDILLRYHFKNHKWINSVECPVYIVHGTDDNVVPFSSGRKLYESVSHGQIEFIKIENGGHNDLNSFQEYWHHLNNILN